MDKNYIKEQKDINKIDSPVNTPNQAKSYILDSINKSIHEADLNSGSSEMLSYIKTSLIELQRLIIIQGKSTGYDFPLQILNENKDKDILGNVVPEQKQKLLGINGRITPFYLVLLRPITPEEATFIRDWIIIRLLDIAADFSIEREFQILLINPQLHAPIIRVIEKIGENEDFLKQ